MKKSKSKKKNKQAKSSGNAQNISVLQVKNNRPTISVCLIVKNEEHFLENCLNSVKEIADEIIIVDTGSQDNTVNIAKRYTDKVYFHPWRDSYSEARNHCLEYAKGDWIFQIDADEELIKKDIRFLLEAIKNKNIDAILVQIVSHLQNNQFETRHNHMRIFRNNGNIYYEGRIHERLCGYKKAKIYPVHLIHYGYDLKDDDLSEEKNQRRIKLLKMDIEDFPDNPLPYHYLSCCYLSKELFRETRDVGLKSISLADKHNDKDPIYLWTRYNVAVSYYKLKDLKNAETIALSAIANDRRHIDSYYMLALTNFDQSKWTNVIKYGNVYLRLSEEIKKNPENFNVSVNNSLNESWKILLVMGISFHEIGDMVKSKEVFDSAVTHSNDIFKTLKTIGLYFFNKALFHEADKYLKRAFDINAQDHETRDMLAHINSMGALNNISLSKNDLDLIPARDKNSVAKEPLVYDRLLTLCIDEEMPDKAMEIIENHKENIADIVLMLCKMAYLYIENGRLESAVKCYSMALEKNPDLAEAWESLGLISLNLNKLDDARIFYSKALELNKNNTEILLGLCEVNARLGNTESVIKDCNVLLGLLGIPGGERIGTADELKKGLNKIDSALNQESCSAHIRNIISNLPSTHPDSSHINF